MAGNRRPDDGTDDINKRTERWTDVFETQTVKTTTNDSNLAGHYPYSQERWRVFKGSNDTGNRLFPEYNSVSEYNHAGDYHELQPAAGETIILESAERYRYSVQYELEATWAWAINQSLQGNDYVRCGFYDGTDGWFLEHNGGHSDREVDLVLLRNGSEQYRVTELISTSGFQTNTRFGLETAWYDITRQKWTESESDDGDQRNETIATVSNDDARGPRSGNQLLRFEVQADAATTGLVLEAGSAAIVTKGGGEDNTRSKAIAWVGDETDTIGTADTWVPLRAYREIPDREVVNNQLLSMSILSYSQDTPVQLALQSFDETNVTFDGTDSWATPDTWSRTNNALEVRADVNEFADATGTLTTTATDAGGHQIGYAVLTPTSGNQFQKGASEVELGTKRNLPNGDVAVVLGYAGATGDIGHAETFEEDW
jgi:hypothetical protein